MPIGQVVEELSKQYPDVSHSSLRFLEREQLVEPRRTPGGHRLYSEDDIERIRRIKEWQLQRLSLEDIRRRLEAADVLESPETLARQFLDLAIAGDQPGAQALILEADELGMPLNVLFQNVLRPALYETGDRWESQELLVGQEKEISQIARDIVAELSLRHAASVYGNESIVAACVAGEFHELGLRMVAGMLRSRGYQVHFLGPSVDSDFLIEVIKLRMPRVVLLTATVDDRLPDIENAIGAIHQQIDRDDLPAIVIGGQVTMGHCQLIEGWNAIAVEEDDVLAITDTVITCFLS